MYSNQSSLARGTCKPTCGIYRFQIRHLIMADGALILVLVVKQKIPIIFHETIHEKTTVFLLLLGSFFHHTFAYTFFIGFN